MPMEEAVKLHMYTYHIPLVSYVLIFPYSVQIWQKNHENSETSVENLVNGKYKYNIYVAPRILL